MSALSVSRFRALNYLQWPGSRIAPKRRMLPVLAMLAGIAVSHVAVATDFAALGREQEANERKKTRDAYSRWTQDPTIERTIYVAPGAGPWKLTASRGDPLVYFKLNGNAKGNVSNTDFLSNPESVQANRFRYAFSFSYDHDNPRPVKDKRLFLSRDVRVGNEVRQKDAEISMNFWWPEEKIFLKRAVSNNHRNEALKIVEPGVAVDCLFQKNSDTLEIVIKNSDNPRHGGNICLYNPDNVRPCDHGKKLCLKS